MDEVHRHGMGLTDGHSWDEAKGNYGLPLSLQPRRFAGDEIPGGDHTAAHRNVQAGAATLLKNGVPKILAQQYVRVMTVECPISINAHVSHENALQYWRAVNNPSVKANMPSVKKQ